jgi:acetyl-CoA carboxylase carboxyl transferase subunit beta
MDWFKLTKKIGAVGSDERKVKTEGLWIKCEGCRQIIWRKDLAETMQCCAKCGFHFRIDARTRLQYLMDGGSWQEHDTDLVSTDPLDFVDSKPYKVRLAGIQKST